jgi:hypothetical protein
MSTPKKPRYAPLSPAASERLEPYRDLMGKRPDGEIAKLAGMDRRYVVVFRYYNDLPAYRRGNAPKAGKSAKGGKPSRSRKSKLDEFRHLMGEVPDGRIAELADCSREAVMRYRKRHGISPAPRRAPAAPMPATNTEPVAAPPVEPAPVVEAPAPVDDDLPPEADEVMDVASTSPPPAEPQDATAPLEGWLVTVRDGDGDEEYLLLAADLVEAAQEAVRMLGARDPGAQVVELTYAADLL